MSNTPVYQLPPLFRSKPARPFKLEEDFVEKILALAFIVYLLWQCSRSW